MSIREVRMGLGAFDVDLVDDTPAHILRQMRVSRGGGDTLGYGALVVTNQRVDPDDFRSPSDPATEIHPLLSAARYTGVIRDVENKGHTLSGHGLLGLLNDADNAGTWTTQLTDHRTVVYQAGALIRFLIVGHDNVLCEPVGAPVPITLFESHLRDGGIAIDTTQLAISDLRPHRALIGEISARTGKMFRVDPDGRFYWDDEGNLFRQDPQILVGDGLPADTDPRWPTVRAPLGDWAETTKDYVAGYLVDSPGQDGPWVTAAAGGDYWTPIKGKALVARDTLDVDPTDETEAQWLNRAGFQIAYQSLDHWSASVSGEVIGGDHVVLVPGEQVYLWSHEWGIEDPANTITYAGHPIRPVKVPLLATSWAPAEGMGVYAMWSPNGAPQKVLDLTDWVDLAPTRTVDLELGAPRPIL